jgi:hypothetical protein
MFEHDALCRQIPLQEDPRKFPQKTAPVTTKISVHRRFLCKQLKERQSPLNIIHA